jgi:hypothetical protein
MMGFKEYFHTKAKDDREQAITPIPMPNLLDDSGSFEQTDNRSMSPFRSRMERRIRLACEE